ncbi:MAG: polysaccharide deacetylase family protein [Clostridia bacterium]
MNQIHKLRYASVNIIIVALIVTLYFALNSEGTLPAINTNIIYMGESDKKIAFQCTVSYNAAALSNILDLVNARGIKMTFIVSGEWAVDNKDMLNKIASDGHEIATMGMRYYLDGPIEDDIRDSISIIENITGKRPAFYFIGEKNVANTASACEKERIWGILCTVDLLSSRGGKYEIIARAKRRLVPGSIISVSPTAHLFDALPDILDLYANAGLSVVPTGEVANISNG